MEADAVEARGVVRLRERDVGLADGQPVGAEAADQHLDYDLEEAGEDDGIEEAEYGVVEVPEGADPQLGECDDDDGDKDGEHAREGRGDDPAALGVGKLRVDDVARGVKGDGEVAGAGVGGLVDLVGVSDLSLFEELGGR